MRSADHETLDTERLSLRPQIPSDASVLHRLWTERDPRVPAHRRIDGQGRPAVADLADRIARATPAPLELLTVVRKQDGAGIGYCGLIPVHGPDDETGLGFELLRDCWNRGYATEAATAVAEAAAAAGHDRLVASVWEWNTASRRVLAKLGFEEVSRTAHPGHGVDILTANRLAPASRL